MTEPASGNTAAAGATPQSESTLKGWRLVLSNMFFIPQRYVFAIMSLLAIANAYTMRVCLNITITQMVLPKPAPNKSADPDACPISISRFVFEEEEEEPYPLAAKIFNWDEATQGLLLSAFYYGYVLTHLPGGMIAEAYGGKWIVGCGLLFTAVGTLLTPVLVQWGGGLALFIVRFIEGLGEGPTMPGLMAMVSRWAPRDERGCFGAIVFGGAQIGNIAGSFFSGLVLAAGPWDNVFYLFGGLGFLWFICWVLLCFNTPNSHPYIKDSEKKFLNGTVDSLIKAATQTRLDPVPWKALLRSCPLWTLIVAAIGHDWGYFTMVTDLPKYMTDVLRFNIKKAGFLSALPYIAMWVSSFFFGLSCDFCTKRGYLSIKNARKLYTTIAATGPGICIILASYSGCNKALAVFWFVAAMTLMGSYYCGMKINTLDITPNYAGTATSLVNGIAAISAIITPYLIGLLTPQSTMKQWRIAFWICLAVLVVTNIVYVIWASGEQQWWDDVKKHGYPSNWKHGPLKTHSDNTSIPPPLNRENPPSLNKENPPQIEKS